jgi:hypothetical protein
MSLLLQRGHCSNIWLAHVLLNSQCTAIRKGMEITFGRAFVFFARLSRRIPFSVGHGCIGNMSGVFGLSGAWPCAATFAPPPHPRRAHRRAKLSHMAASERFLIAAIRNTPPHLPYLSLSTPSSHLPLSCRPSDAGRYAADEWLCSRP